MSKFFDEVYVVVKNIPAGYVMNYGMVATLAGCPRNARQVGYALHANPDPQNIPCHRVVMRDGGMSDGFAFGGPDEQRRRLESEGVTFVGDKVDMTKHLVDINHFIE